MQEVLAQRFSCDAGETIRSLFRFRARDMEGVVGELVGSDPDLARRFPMRRDDLFLCADELVLNALKKSPRPGMIKVRVERSGQKRVRLIVHDDGAPLRQERERTQREGSRSGTSRILHRLEPYGGTFELRDAAVGGVEAELQLPVFDLN
jgi:signal transduction histidine kinase